MIVQHDYQTIYTGSSEQCTIYNVQLCWYQEHQRRLTLHRHHLCHEILQVLLYIILGALS